jgi:hypothetical protein
MFKHKSVAAIFLAAALSFPPYSAAQNQTGGAIYGSQLMTQQERNEYRAKMRSLRTAQEREQLRFEHHERMQQRARERGVTLPDAPPARGARGAGPGGPGMGPGGGMGGPGGR